LALLTGAGLLAADFPADPGVDVALLASLASAVYSYMRRSTGRLMMVQLEDVLALPLQMNLPGTVDEHPNWRLRYPASVEQMLADPLLLRFLDTLSRADGGTDR
jgi:4-alpha-glucanotransferase